jgi:hypothetical protein
MRYIGIYNDTIDECRYAEQWPDTTPEDKAWLKKMLDRMELTVSILRPEVWKVYNSTSPIDWLNSDEPIP